jgi:hypothetical protein
VTWTKSSIEAVKKATSLTAIVSHRVKLTAEGNAFVGRCPFHKDDTPSFGVDPRKQLWNCRGGCGGGDVFAFEMRARSLTFVEAVKHLSEVTGVPLVDEPQQARRRVAAYDYTDAAGTVLYTIERWEPGQNGRSKDFIQRLPDGTAKKSEQQVLFGLPAVVAAVAAGKTVYVVEGEKAALALRTLGVCVTTHAGGSSVVAKTWTPAFAAPLKGGLVVLLPDNDEPGRKAMDTIATVLAPIAADVRVVTLPVTGKGDDAVEWIAGGGTRPKLEELVLGAAATTAAPLPASGEERLTDSGNAERWVQRHGKDFRFAAVRDRWLRWSGSRWELDDVGAAGHSTKHVARSWLVDAAACEGASRRIELVKHAMASEKRARREAMLALATQEPGVSVTPDALDADPWALNCANGVVDLKTGTLRPHRREDLCTKQAPVAFDADAKAPVFDAFLASSLPDADLRAFVQRFLGYALTGVIREHVLPVFWGSGGNGKGTLVEAVKAVVGDYAQAIPSETLIQRNGESHPTELAALMGLRLAFASETGRGQAAHRRRHHQRPLHAAGLFQLPPDPQDAHADQPPARRQRYRRGRVAARAPRALHGQAGHAGPRAQGQARRGAAGHPALARRGVPRVAAQRPRHRRRRRQGHRSVPRGAGRHRRLPRGLLRAGPGQRDDALQRLRALRRLPEVVRGDQRASPNATVLRIVPVRQGNRKAQDFRDLPLRRAGPEGRWGPSGTKSRLSALRNSIWRGTGKSSPFVPWSLDPPSLRTRDSRSRSNTIIR